MKLAELYTQLTIKDNGFNRAIKGVQNQNMIASRGFNKLGAAAAVAAATMLAALAAMAAATAFHLGKSSVKAYASFDLAMIKSTSIMLDVTEKQKKTMAELAKQLSTTNLQSATELAEAYYFLASAGLAAEQQMASLDVVAKFATAGSFDMSKATDLLTDAQSALGLSSKNTNVHMKNMIMLSDALVGASTLANASVQQFAEALTADAASAMQTLNVELNEGLAVLALYADKGKKGAEGGNLFARMLRLTTAAAVKNKKAFKQMNIEVFDATGKFVGPIKAIKSLSAALKTMSDTERIAALEMLGFAALSQKSINPLLNMGKAIEEYERKLNAMGGTTKRVADNQMKSLSNQWKVLGDIVTVIGIELGDTMAPVLREITQLLKGMSMEILENKDSWKAWVKFVIEGTKEVAINLDNIASDSALILEGLVRSQMKTFTALVYGAIRSQMNQLRAFQGIVSLLATPFKFMRELEENAASGSKAAQDKIAKYQDAWMKREKEKNKLIKEGNKLAKETAGGAEAEIAITKEKRGKTVTAGIVGVVEFAKNIQIAALNREAQEQKKQTNLLEKIDNGISALNKAQKSTSVSGMMALGA